MNTVSGTIITGLIAAVWAAYLVEKMKHDSRVKGLIEECDKTLMGNIALADNAKALEAKIQLHLKMGSLWKNEAELCQAYCRKLERMLANRKGQITKMKKKLEGGAEAHERFDGNHHEADRIAVRIESLIKRKAQVEAI